MFITIQIFRVRIRYVGSIMSSQIMSTVHIKEIRLEPQ